MAGLQSGAGRMMVDFGPIAPSQFSVELDQTASMNWFTAIARCTILK